MSDFFPRPGQMPSRVQQTEYSQALWQLLKSRLTSFQNANMCEALLMRRFATFLQTISRGTRQKIVRCFVRGYEKSPADVYQIIIDDDADFDRLPEATASEYDLWAWARCSPRGVRFIPMDFKSISITIGRECKKQGHLYSWSETQHYQSRAADSEVCVVTIDGVPNHVLVMPTAAFVASRRSLYGIETLSARAPGWSPLFMVHLSDLEEAMRRIAKVAVEGGVWTNPTSKIDFTDWKPRAFRNANLDEHSKSEPRAASFHNTLRLLREIRAAGCRVEFNPDCPVVHDFYIQVRPHGLLRTEFKEYEDLSTFRRMLRDGDGSSRANPFQDRRQWHVLYLIIAGVTYCVTRDEIGDQGEPDAPDFWFEHTFADFSHALEHIEAHAARAKLEVDRILPRLKPEHVVEGLPRWSIRLKEHGCDPLVGHAGAQVLLPFLGHELNTICMQNGYGVCLPLGKSSPIGTHVLVSHTWTESEKQTFQRYGSLPLALWHRNAPASRCLLLRFMDCSPKQNRMSTSGLPPFTLCRSDWRKCINSMKNVLLICWTGDPDKDRYVVMPSHFTALGAAAKEFLDEPTAADRAAGKHIFHRVPDSDPELKDPAWPSDSSDIRWNSSFIPDKNVDPFRYILTLHDGTFYQQLRDILENTGPGAISRSSLTNNQFAREMYHYPVRDVLQATWDYGYYDSWQVGRGKKNKAGDDEDGEDGELMEEEGGDDEFIL